MDKTLVGETLLEIKQELGRPYPPETSAPPEITVINHFTNFLRSGPLRKTFLFDYTCGDYEYDEGMTVEQESQLELDNDYLFDSVAGVAAAVIGSASLELPPLLPGLSLTDYEDQSKEGQEFDEVVWTPEYEGGAVYQNADSYHARYWEIGNEFLVLQKGKWSGDGNFLFFVLMSITPANKN